MPFIRSGEERRKLFGCFFFSRQTSCNKLSESNAKIFKATRHRSRNSRDQRVGGTRARHRFGRCSLRPGKQWFNVIHEWFGGSANCVKKSSCFDQIKKLGCWLRTIAQPVAVS